jgi:hypothetical protein
MSIFLDNKDRVCLELSKSSDYTDYDSLEHMITCTVYSALCVDTYCVYNIALEYRYIQ